jgi:hypothetical protein
VNLSVPGIPVLWQTAGLLALSNIFMTFAWYAHLKHLNEKPWWIAALISWGIALFEYLIQVPANRIGNSEKCCRLVHLPSGEKHQSGKKERLKLFVTQSFDNLRECEFRLTKQLQAVYRARPEEVEVVGGAVDCDGDLLSAGRFRSALWWHVVVLSVRDVKADGS